MVPPSRAPVRPLVTARSCTMHGLQARGGWHPGGTPQPSPQLDRLLSAGNASRSAEGRAGAAPRPCAAVANRTPPHKAGRQVSPPASRPPLPPLERLPLRRPVPAGIIARALPGSRAPALPLRPFVRVTHPPCARLFSLAARTRLAAGVAAVRTRSVASRPGCSTRPGPLGCALGTGSPKGQCRGEPGAQSGSTRVWPAVGACVPRRPPLIRLLQPRTGGMAHRRSARGRHAGNTRMRFRGSGDCRVRCKCKRKCE